MNLFEIDAQIKHTIELYVDDDTGEISEECWNKLCDLDIEKEKKCLNIAKYYKSLCAEASAIKEAEKVLGIRRKGLEKKAENMKKYLSTFAKGEKYKDSEIVISWRKSESIRIEEGADIPPQYQTVKMAVEPNKKALKKALNEGEEIDGVTIDQNLNIQIK